MCPPTKQVAYCIPGYLTAKHVMPCDAINIGNDAINMDNDATALSKLLSVYIADPTSN